MDSDLGASKFLLSGGVGLAVSELAIGVLVGDIVVYVSTGWADVGRRFIGSEGQPLGPLA